jgi:hypothetical protein
MMDISLPSEKLGTHSISGLPCMVVILGKNRKKKIGRRKWEEGNGPDGLLVDSLWIIVYESRK